MSCCYNFHILLNNLSNCAANRMCLQKFPQKVLYRCERYDMFAPN
jgi:hypothetical protein